MKFYQDCCAKLDEAAARIEFAATHFKFSGAVLSFKF
jgi:hypothetical protein